MRITIDGSEARAETAWFPGLNFGQFRWAGVVATYELEVPRARLIERLRVAYDVMRDELRADDELIPAEASQLAVLGYPPIEELLEHATTAAEILHTYLSLELLDALLPTSAAAEPAFMINSIDRIDVGPDAIRLSGRGYHLAPGDAAAGRAAR